MRAHYLKSIYLQNVMLGENDIQGKQNLEHLNMNQICWFIINAFYPHTLKN